MFRALCIAIPHAREDESFADDLNMKRGIVSGRVALLLRSTEIQPAVSKIRAFDAHSSFLLLFLMTAPFLFGAHLPPLDPLIVLILE